MSLFLDCFAVSLDFGMSVGFSFTPGQYFALFMFPVLISNCFGNPRHNKPDNPTVNIISRMMESSEQDHGSGFVSGKTVQ